MALFSVVRPYQETTAGQWAPSDRAAAAAAAACAFIAGLIALWTVSIVDSEAIG